MARDLGPPPDPSAWLTQNLQFIVFPVAPQYAQQQTWWEDICDTEPDSSTRKKLGFEASGKFQGMDLSLVIDSLRIQWTLTPTVEASELPTMVPSLGPFQERKGPFIDLMEKWLNKCPPIRRIAFTAALIQPVKDQAEGYERLAVYLPKVQIDPDTSEFMYRINRRRNSESGIPNLLINRLTTWLCTRFVVMTNSQLLDEIGQLPSNQQHRQELLGCALQLDINTVPDSIVSELPHDALPRLLRELVRFGEEIAIHGDRSS